MQRRTNIYTNHTEEEIKEYLKNLKEIIEKGDFYIPNTSKKQKNKNFIETYKLNSKKQKEMLLSIEYTDFCYSIDDDDNPNERLYIFAKDYDLDCWGIQNNVLVYIKVVIKSNDYAVIVSFHEPERNIKKLFI